MAQRDPARQVYFFGAHPGHLGAVRPLPKEMKTAIDALEGKVLPLQDGLASLEVVASHLLGEIRHTHDDPRMANLLHNGILFWLPDAPGGYTGNIYRLILYKEK